ncbi:MAG: MerR family transcriptional regulator [Nannocystaceae bacterium]
MSKSNSKYRIQAVAEMTGIPAATLRAWERRYGVPSPMRTDSSYRLYSDADIDVIRKLRELTESGMAPAEAARVRKQYEAESPVPSGEDPFERAQETILEAVERFDPTALEVAVRRMMFLGSAPMVFDRVLAPCMYTIGRRWHAGEISVGQEHMASEILGSAARDMLRLFQHDQDAPLALLACFADEEHALPLYGVAFRFAQWGYHPVILGARTPPGAIRHAAERLDPAIVGMSLTIAPPAHRAIELCEEYAAACGSLPWIVGGRGTSELVDVIEGCGGVCLGAEPVASLRARIEGLIAKARRERSQLSEHTSASSRESKGAETSGGSTKGRG